MNTQFFNTFTALGVPENPPVLCCKYETNPWVFTRINDTNHAQLEVDLASVPPPRILTEATGEASERGGAIALLISLPTIGTAGSPSIRVFVWSDTETNAAVVDAIIVPFIQPTGFTYASPAPGRWMCSTFASCGRAPG